MADVPDQLVLKTHRDLEGIGWTVWIRRGVIALLTVLIILALLNVFGQRPVGSKADATQASLQLYAPNHLRGGLLYMARFTITAHQDVKKAVLVLDSGWGESITINTIEPSPIGEASDNGRFSFELGHIPAGAKYRLFMDFQVNPNNVGGHDQDVELLDDKTHILTLHHSIFVYP